MDPNKNLVPEGITFGRNLLLTPSLIEMGVPKVMSCLLFVTTHAGIGTWINRDDPLLTYHFYFYPTLEKPSFWKLWDRDKPCCHSYTLTSPISGWVINHRPVGCRQFFSIQCLNHLVGGEGGLPTILIPDDEPKWEDCQLSDVSQSISNDLSLYWQKNVHNCGKKFSYKMDRLANVINQEIYNYGTVGNEFDASDEEILEAIEWSKRPMSTESFRSWIVCDYDDIKNHQTGGYESFYDLDSYVEEYRSKVIQLRLLFRHLIKK